jgi:uncharacterized protein YcaQ
MKSILAISSTQARRLAITKQHLAGKRPRANANGILNLVRDLGCLQIDPINVIARPQYLILWSRLGNYNRAYLDQLLWQDRKLFEYWAHCASIVLTEDYPIHNLMMRTYARDNSPWSKRVQKFLVDNDAVRKSILAKIRRQGAISSRELVDERGKTKAWVSTGWTTGHTTSRLLDFLWLNGTLMTAGRDGLQKVWDLAERRLPDWTPREKWSEPEIVRHAAQRSLRALGVATPRHIQNHFIRGRYPNLERILDELERKEIIERVQIVDDGVVWKGDWYIHAEDVTTLKRLERTWEPRTTFLSPFDNLICDRARTKLLFKFDYTMEIYVPASKRKYGYYVLPILHGDSFVGRMDAAMDRSEKSLIVNTLYAEPNISSLHQTAHAVRASIEELAQFLGAEKIAYKRIPSIWKSAYKR